VIVTKRFIGISIFIMFLVSCSPVNATEKLISTPSPFSQSVPTTTILQTSTPIPSATPDITETEFVQEMIPTLTAKETLVAQYPQVCDNLYSPREFSPNGLWMVESCYSKSDDSLILTLSNHENQAIWKLVYRDYIQQGDVVPDGGLAVVQWSKDGKYIYFNSFTSGSGGYCFASGNVLNYGKGLFRLDLETGVSTTVLPLKEDFVGYEFSFSSTGRRLVYEASSSGIKILDLRTGILIDVSSIQEFTGAGGFLWSPNGLQFVYSTVNSINYGENITYSLRIVDTQYGDERILVESQNNCFAARLWSENNILTVEQYDENYDRTFVEIDLSSNQIISESIVTPSP